MKSLKEKIEVEQACLDGKGIAYIDERGNVITLGVIEDIFFDWKNKDYYIKQEPMEFLLDVYIDGEHITTQEHKASGFIKTIKVREVTDE